VTAPPAIPVEGSRVAVVGGSIAGCAAAIALLRSGCRVTVYERSTAELRERGYGIVMPVPASDELISAGYLDVASAAMTSVERLWLVRDPCSAHGTGFGRVVWHQPLSATLNNWGALWRVLRGRVPDANYRAASTVTEIISRPDGAVVVTNTPEHARFDIVIGADGYRSMTRRLVDPKARPTYAGYSLWRGNYPETRLPTPVPAELEANAITVCFPHGHAIFYLIPDFAGGRRINWAVYLAIPHARRFLAPTSVPPGSVGADLLAHLDRVLRHFPDYWADVVRRTHRAELTLQPVYDATVRSYVSGGMMLIGDAGTVVRPHTGSGATKALQDALILGRACAEYGSWDRVLAGYDQARCGAGNALVALGQRMGYAQVQHTPQWDAMSQRDFDDWMLRALSGTDYPH
jgi:2-polyprenyl-6-methoxyphenol hydroxylase-like FAD-dependent oxidoreductase